MCNSYRIQPKRGATGLAGRVSEATARLASELVRESDSGVVVRADGRVDVMRWGFQRRFNPSINNARSDKLEGGMWKDAFHKRRCVIPMGLFYEWGPGNGGRKQAHEFSDPDDAYLWAAGIWEERPVLGPCYSMITTAASPLMAPIHDRMRRSFPRRRWRNACRRQPLGFSAFHRGSQTRRDAVPLANPICLDTDSRYIL